MSMYTNPFAMFFNAAYMVAIWSVFILVVKNYLTSAPQLKKPAGLLILALAALISGDSVHVLTQFYAFFTKTVPLAFEYSGYPINLLGVGFAATSFGMSLFYGLLLLYYHAALDRPWGWFSWLLVIALAVRLALLPCPLNEWGGEFTTWRIYRNIPFSILGLGIAYLFVREASVRIGYRKLGFAGWTVVASFAFYWIVLLGAPLEPALAAFMLPKSIAYVLLAYLLYKFTFEDLAPRPAQAA